MDEVAKSKRLVDRFSKYIEHRKKSAPSDESFTEKLARLEQDAPAKTEPAHSGRVQSRSSARSARRSQPPRLADPKSITSVQAQRIARYAPLIESCARKYNVPVELICGVILQESGGNARAVSSAGARGLMQLMPATARRFGVSNPFDPRQNIEGGVRYLRFLLDRFQGRIDLALAGYNSGEGNVEKYGNKIPPFRETQQYVPNVLGYTQSMIDIFLAKSSDLPSHARRV